MTRNCEIPGISIGDKVDVIIRETGQPIRTGNPIVIESTGYHINALAAYATESDGTRRVFRQSKFKFLKV